MSPFKKSLAILAASGLAAVVFATGAGAAPKAPTNDPVQLCTALGGTMVENNSGVNVQRRCHADRVTTTVVDDSYTIAGEPLVVRVDNGNRNPVVISGTVTITVVDITTTTTTEHDIYQWATGGGGKWNRLDQSWSEEPVVTQETSTSSAVDAGSCRKSNNGGDDKPCEAEDLALLEASAA